MLSNSGRTWAYVKTYYAEQTLVNHMRSVANWQLVTAATCLGPRPSKSAKSDVRSWLWAFDDAPICSLTPAHKYSCVLELEGQTFVTVQRLIANVSQGK